MYKRLYKRLRFEILNGLSAVVCQLTSLTYDKDFYSNNSSVAEIKLNGFVNLGDCGISVGDAAKVLSDTFENSCFERNRLMSLNNTMKLEALNLYLQNEKIVEVVQSYIGANARFDRLWCYRIPSTMKQTGLSGDWHHDRVGKRLKMFVLLHDVTDADRPMELISGSHVGTKRRFGFRGSRMSETSPEYEKEKVRKLMGRKGDIILFDTNLMHRADWSEGQSDRDVLSFEFADRRKGDFLQLFDMPIGTVQTEVNSEFYNLASPLIDKRHIQVNGKQIFYGKKLEITTNSYEL